MMFSAYTLEPRGLRLARWTGAAVLVATLHIGGGSYAMLYWQEAMLEEASGALVVEIAPITTASIDDAHDLPLGPLTDEAVAKQASSDRNIERMLEETPKEDLPSPNLQAEVVLPKPTLEETVKEEVKQDPSPKVEVAKEETAASVSMAPTKILAPKADKAAASSFGTSLEAHRNFITWQSTVIQHIKRHAREFDSAKGQGTAHVHFVIDRSGRLITFEIARTSGAAQLDQEALAWLKRASPLPRPPTTMQGESFDFTIPMRFTPTE
jgi:periplasmic protein TonB